MILSSITWADVETFTTLGIPAILGVITGLIWLASKVIPQIAQLKIAIATLNEKSDKHGQEIVENRGAITSVATKAIDIALSTPVPTVTPAAEIHQLKDQIAELTKPGP